MTPPARPVALAGASDDVLLAAGGGWQLLSGAEAARARTLRRDVDRRDFVAAHALARVCAGRVLARAPRTLTVEQRCAHCGGSHGRPRLAEAPELRISLSHTRGHVAAVAGTGRVGIDVERYRAIDAGMIALATSPAEVARVEAAPDVSLAFLRLWVCKEALIKAGAGDLDSMPAIDLAEACPAEDAPGTWRAVWEGWHLLQWTDPAAEVLGAAVGAAPPLLAASE